VPTQFINSLFMKEVRPVGNELTPCTVKIAAEELEIPSEFQNDLGLRPYDHVLVVDTPGLDSENELAIDSYISTNICKWLEQW